MFRSASISLCFIAVPRQCRRRPCHKCRLIWGPVLQTAQPSIVQRRSKSYPRVPEPAQRGRCLRGSHLERFANVSLGTSGSADRRIMRSPGIRIAPYSRISAKALCLACRSSTVEGDATGPERQASCAKSDEESKPQSRAEKDAAKSGSMALLK